MTMTLLLVAALAATCALALLAWSQHRDAHERSGARVAALASAIDGPRAAAAPNGLAAAARLFEAGRTSAMQGRPLLKVAIGFAMPLP